MKKGDKVMILAMPEELRKIGIRGPTIKEIIGQEQTVYAVVPRSEGEGLMVYIRDITDNNQKILWVYSEHCVEVVNG
jgi:hypothetical protein